MNAQFISLGTPSDVRQLIASHQGLSGELVHLGVAINNTFPAAGSTGQLLDLLEQAAQTHDLIFLFTQGELAELAGALADALDLPLTEEKPQGAVSLSAGEASGFVLTEGDQAIICLPGQPQPLFSLLSQGVIPFLVQHFFPGGCLKNLPLPGEQLPFAQEYAASFHEPNSHVAVYENGLRILCLTPEKASSQALAQEIAQDFLDSLIQQAPPAAPLSLREKLENAKAAPSPQEPQPPKKWYQKLLPWKGDNKGEIFRKSVLLVSALVFIGSLSYIGSYYYRSYINEKHYSSLEEIYEGSGSKPEGYPSDYQNKFAGLYAINPEIAGWLQIPGTPISYPVVQTDNNFDYLKKDFYGNKIPHGTPYVDCQVDLKEESSNTIIYAHNMKDGQMFAPLMDYQKLSFYKEHPVISFDSVYRNHQYKIISVFITNNKPEHGEIFPYHEFIEADSAMEMSQFLSNVLARSLINTGVDVQPSDRLLTLSTCTYEFDDARFVVVARAVRKGESASVDTSKASMNPAPLMPDIWYQLYGGSHPNGEVTTPPAATPPSQPQPPVQETPEETPPQEEIPEQPEAPEETPEETPQPPAEEAPEETPPQEEIPEQPETPEETPPPQQPEQPAPAPEETPEPEPPAQLQESPPSQGEIFRCPCKGCNYISKHDNCTGDVNNCPCDCGICADKSSSKKEPSYEEEEEDGEDREDEEDYSDVDFDETLKVKIGGKSKTYDTYDLICQIVQNEMGSSFHQEALKAQAVAAYSYIKYNNNQGIAPSVLVKTSVSSPVKSAVRDVLGEGVYYNGKICNTTYFSSSAGVTNNAEDVWGGRLPYLVSVDAQEDEDNKYYGATVKISQKDMAKYIKNYLGIDPEGYGDPEEWIEDIATFDNDMYVSSVQVAGKKITGRQFREGLLGSRIYSHAFEVDFDGDSFVFTTYGYGHGVGMSQLGAQALAQDGEDYEEILEHYYTGVSVR